MHRMLWAMVLVCLVGTVEQARADEAVGDRPNIVVILADDLGWGDLGSYNAESKIPTPHMDALAAEGMRFTDAHSPSAVCTPTRYGLLTGRYPWRTRLKSGVLWGFSRSLIEPQRLTLPRMLQERGYHTAIVGKWHLGFQEFNGDNNEQVDYEKPLRPGPVTLGFDSFFGIPASLDMEPYLYVDNDQPLESATEHIEASRHRRQGGGGFWRAGPIAPNFKHIEVHPTLTEKSVDYIEQRETEDQPFFLYLPLASPHTPWVPTKAFEGSSEMDAHGGQYGDFVAEVDWTVGQVMEALKRTGQAENTLLIVTSDNGSHWLSSDVERYDHHANGPFRGQKADIHEGGHRVPFIVRWPGRVSEDATSDQLLCLTDLMATFAALVDYDLPDDAAEDSFDMLPVLLHGTEEPIRTSAVHHALRGVLALREGPWKLIPNQLGSGGFTNPQDRKPQEGGPGGQLYHLGDDLAEQHNVWQANPEVVARMQQRLKDIRESGRSR